MKNIYSAFIVFLQCIVIKLEYCNGAEKDHYTSTHWKLHDVIRKTTHAHLKDFEIVVPESVDRSGNHLGYEMMRRTRRSLPAEEEESISVQGFGEKFLISLTPNNNLIAPNFKLNRRRRDTDTGRMVEEEETDKVLTSCHYSGRILSHQNRRTAISTCDGITGLLRTEEDDFIIEPVSPNVDHDFPHPQHPHILYKRRHLAKNNEQHMHYCGKKKHHPMSMFSGEDRGVRYLSDGEPVFKTVKELSQEYSRMDEDSTKGHGEEEVVERRRRNTISSVERTDSGRKTVETLVVADQQMVKNHLGDHRDISTYILTVMNMVAGLFHDGSLGRSVDIVLVEIRILEDNDELHVDHRADKSLSNFCHWQNNGTGGSKRHDYAILLTGVDICVDKNQPCDTLGLAQIGGMCSGTDSCTINEDMGLGLAFTVAHETGHSFGMRHDGQGNSCSKRGGHIMSPTLNGLNGVFTWSSCSRMELNKFLSGPHSHCLNDPPSPLQTSITGPNDLPGQIYSANEQCKWQFGTGATMCYYRHQDNQHTICKALWCQRSDGVCETKYMPAAEGTECGADKWCRRGVCVSHGSEGPLPVDGGWSEFGAWSVCSRTCGGGVTYRERQCTNPFPKYGGRYCEGESKIYQLCNVEDCAPGSIDYRAKQCAEFNGKPYRRQYFSWVPFTKYYKYNLNKCELLCKATGYGFFDMLSPKVEDGTRCDDESKDVCINGRCVHVGCDNVLNSDAKIDACGICNGNNSTCKFVNGSFTKPIVDSDYYQVTTIPAGARSIKIWELSCCTHTYIAVRSALDANNYYLNGNWRVDFSGDMDFAGAKWRYDRKVLETEVLQTDGPLREDIVIEALVVRKNPGIAYSYALEEIDNRIPSLRTFFPPTKDYSWQTHISSCSKSCAGGEQRTTLTCVENGNLIVNNSFCLTKPKPDATIQACNTQPCPPKWDMGKWGKCSRTCGGGLQTRVVTCRQLTSTGFKYVSSSKCSLVDRPQRNQMCNRQECPPAWVIGEWSKCSKMCGRGERKRTVSCQSGLRVLSKSKCKGTSKKPRSRQTCFLTRCKRNYQWFISAWGECSSSCGKGLQKRQLRCSFKNRVGQYRPVSNKKCTKDQKPKVLLRKTCNNPIKCTQITTTEKSSTVSSTQDEEGNIRSEENVVNYQNHPRRTYTGARWVASPWQACTVTCGGGSQVRVVKCLLRGKPSTRCSYTKKLATTRSCNLAKCAIPTIKEPSECVDKHKWCYLVPQHNTCSHAYFGVQCCKSCKESSGS